jgi:ATP-binding cassette subfamily F protein 3
MPSLIATSLAMAFGPRPLFEGLSLHVEPKDRIALVGPNGAGKTTLLRVLAGALEPTGGEVQVPSHLTVALHDQRPDRTSQTVFDAVSPAAAVDAEQRLRTLEQEMASGDEAVLTEYQHVRDAFDRVGGDSWRSNVERVLRGLGFRDEQFDQTLDTLSGGELTRASLARALAAQPDVLLLDEPTNHLDVAAIEWLEGFLDELTGAVVLVSHDRWLIERVCTSVVEVAHGRCRRFVGSFVEYRAQQALEMIATQKEMERAQDEIGRLQQFVAKFQAGTRSRQAQSRVKALDRLKKELPQYADLSKRRTMRFKLPTPERSGRETLDARELKLVVPRVDGGERVLLEHGNLVVERGEKVALMGPNGSGKSTLLSALASACISDITRPEAMRDGEIRVGYGVTARLISQHDSELQGHMSMVANMQLAAPNLPRRDALSLLGLFGFTGEDGDRLVDRLSGGERRRLLLSMALTGSANLLLIDEPTNHLDLEGREALETALAHYEGTLVLISHDRALLEAVATRRVELRDCGLHAPAPPPVAAPQVQSKGSKRTPTSGGAHQRTIKRDRTAAPRKARPKNAVKVRRPATIEREIEALETELQEIGARMLEPEVYSSKQLSADALERHSELEKQIEQRFSELERAVDHHGE